MNRILPGRTVPLFFMYLVCFVFEGYAQQSFDAKRIEIITSAVIKKGYPACVRLWGFDTVKKVQNSAQFTGVVVTAEGHILTAAHAIIPGKTYLVNFPDGRTAIAEGKGRIAAESQGRPDVAMVKIVTKGAWPFAEIGWSSSSKLNSMCVSIAYPTTLNQKLPSVRFGRISRLPDVWGFMVSTCIMEPGDSGGPLFDELGRVIGLHSRIDVNEKINYEVPVDLYRKYWTALNVAEDYKTLPSKEDDLGSDPQQAAINHITELENLEAQFGKSAFNFNGSCLRISSELNGKPQQVYGTVLSGSIKASNTQFKSGTLLVSKSSLIGEHAVVDLGTGRNLTLTVVSRDKENDLILLYVAARLKSAISLKALADTPSIKFSEVGKFLLSAMPGQNNRLSVLGSTCFGQDKKFSSGYFGASATFINKQILLTRIAPGSPAEKAGLMLQDQVTGINGVPISLPPEYGKEIMKYEPGDTINIQGVRGGAPYNLSVNLGLLPVTGNHPADHFVGGKSKRRDGFRSVFTHDAMLKPEECGGPVFDLTGKFYGINIARFSRTSCLAIPTLVIYQFVLSSL
ncbi:serine protease [Pedobacter sp. ok626]|uniref:S1 family peptidase n=1 Tax=Pedobacter sp. ok626 TaxID=1761882 RepID=UPI000B82E326|nr:serine protease [Pedobacter sp. ok626]